MENLQILLSLNSHKLQKYKKVEGYSVLFYPCEIFSEAYTSYETNL